MSDQRAVDLLAFGESMVSVAPEDVGPLATARGARFRVGGAESNVCIGAARLGHRARWVSSLGADGQGDLVERAIRGEGVEVHAHRDPTRPTGLMVKECRTPRHTRVTYYRAGSAASALTSGDVPDELLAATRLVHVSGITAGLSPDSTAHVAEVLDRARGAGAQVSFDLNYRAALWPAEHAAAAYRDLLGFADVVFGGLGELRLLDPHIDGIDAAWELVSASGVRQLVALDGARGAQARTVDDKAATGVYDVPVVDTVGAGDAFVAGYLTAHLEGLELADRLDRGARVAAFVCMTHGDWEGMPTRAELGYLGDDQQDPVQR